MRTKLRRGWRGRDRQRSTKHPITANLAHSSTRALVRIFASATPVLLTDLGVFSQRFTGLPQHSSYRYTRPIQIVGPSPSGPPQSRYDTSSLSFRKFLHRFPSSQSHCRLPRCQHSLQRGMQARAPSPSTTDKNKCRDVESFPRPSKPSPDGVGQFNFSKQKTTLSTHCRFVPNTLI